MSNHRAFRLHSIETLEDRAVPSGFGFPFENGSGGLGGLISSIPSQDAQLVRQAFQQFDQTYLKDVQTILFAAGTNPSANVVAFDQAVVQALSTLNTSIDSAINNLPTAVTLEAEIEAELIGIGLATLEGQLAAIPVPAVATHATEVSFVRSSQAHIGQSTGLVTQQVASAPLPIGAVAATTVQTDLKAIRAAFETFTQAYNTAVKSTLLAKGTTPSANRAAFNTAVSTALTTLNSGITSAIGNLPATVSASLTTKIGNDLLTGTQTTGTDLQSRLLALKTPASTGGFGSWFFRLGSSLNIGFTQGEVINDLVAAVQAYNGSL